MDGMMMTPGTGIVRDGKLVGHLCSLRALDCVDGSHETEVVIHLYEQTERGAPNFHSWRKAGEGLEKRDAPMPEHAEGGSEVEAFCYDTDCIHCPKQEDEDNPLACPKAQLRGGLTLGEDSDGHWYHFQFEDFSEITCESYERREDADEAFGCEYREAEAAGQQVLSNREETPCAGNAGLT